MPRVAGLANACTPPGLERRMNTKARTARVARGSEKVPPQTSRDRLLDAGERLFAEHGYDGVALRAIADGAKVNLGIIPYFFGTKANLFKAVMLRRIEPIQRERHARLQALLAKPHLMTIEAVLMALLEPVFSVSRERSASDPAPEVRKVMDEIYDPATVLTPTALKLLCPHLEADEFHWRFACLYGAMFYIQADTGRMQSIAGPGFDTSRPDTALPYLIPAFAAFFRAPARGTATAPVAPGQTRDP
jgi:AcrR family transcriptional regulator